MSGDERQSTIGIREATDHDAPRLAALLDQLGYPARPQSVASRLNLMLAEPGQHALVALDGERVVGLVTVIVRHVLVDDAPFARLSALVVDVGWRGAGVGRALVARAEAIARSAGCSAIEVTSGDHRPQAHAFYSALGFVEQPRRFLKTLDG